MSAPLKPSPVVPENEPDCPVCASKYTPVVRVPFQCSECEYTCCVSCVKTYLLSLPHDDYMCMSCNTRWDMPFLSSLGPAFFNGDLKNHRATCLMVKEKALLADPSTLGAVQRLKAVIKARDRLNTCKIRERVLNRQLHELEHELSLVRNERIQARFMLDEYESERGENTLLVATPHSAPIHCAVPECRGFLPPTLTCVQFATIQRVTNVFNALTGQWLRLMCVMRRFLRPTASSAESQNLVPGAVNA